MNFLKDMAAAGDVFSSIANAGTSSAEFGGYIDTGCYMLNAVLSGSLYGGVADNKVTAFAGEQATGKTFFILGIVKSFLDSNQQAGVLYYDTEGAVTKAMMESRGIDTKRVLIGEPSTIQEFRTDALKKLEAYEANKTKGSALLMVLDSLGMLSTTKEMEDIGAGKETRDMTKSQVIKGAFRVLTLKLARAKVPLLVTNHVYEVVGSYVPTKELSGGSGLKFAASTIGMLTKKKERDGTQAGAEIIGNVITVKMWKSRLSKENAKTEVLLTYRGGLDRYYGLLDFGVEHGVFNRIANKYEIPGITEKAIKAKAIYADPDKYFTAEILQKLEAFVQQEFQYGSGDEQPETDDETEE